jgi:CRP-like cAMP-binding protein
MKSRRIGLDPDTGAVDYSFHEEVINRFAKLPKEEWNYLQHLLGIKTVKKGSHLLREGERCRTLYYIIKGGARFYYVNSEGEEVTKNFIFENNFVIAFDSLFSQLPTTENIVMLEDSVLFTLSDHHFNDLLHRHHVWEVLLNKLIAKHFLRIIEKERLLLLCSYDSRYMKVMETMPYLFQRVEQQYIASYLGMTPETLCRVKRRTYQRTVALR